TLPSHLARGRRGLVATSPLDTAPRHPSPTLFPYTTLFRSVEDAARVRHVRDAVGDDVTLAIDANESLGLEEAKRLCRLVEDLNRSEEHTSELQSRENLVCRLLLEKKNARRRGSATRAGLEE